MESGIQYDLLYGSASERRFVRAMTLLMLGVSFCWVLYLYFTHGTYSFSRVMMLESQLEVRQRHQTIELSLRSTVRSDIDRDVDEAFHSNAQAEAVHVNRQSVTSGTSIDNKYELSDESVRRERLNGDSIKIVDETQVFDLQNNSGRQYISISGEQGIRIYDADLARSARQKLLQGSSASQGLPTSRVFDPRLKKELAVLRESSAARNNNKQREETESYISVTGDEVRRQGNLCAKNNRQMAEQMGIESMYFISKCALEIDRIKINYDPNAHYHLDVSALRD